MPRYPWGHRAPREHLRRVRQGALQALNDAKYDGYDEISFRLKAAGREAKPLLDCLEYLRSSGLRRQNNGHNPVPSEKIEKVITDVLNTLPDYVTSNYGNIKDNFEVFATAMHKAIQLAEDILECGAEADENGDKSELWKRFDA